MRRAPLLAALPALALAACGSTPAAPADAAVDAAAAQTDAAVDAAPQSDAAGWGTTGARVVRSVNVKPWSIACGSGPCGEPILSFETVLRARPVAVVDLDAGVGLGYQDDLTPTTVPADVGTTYDTATGPRRPFATTEPAVWAFAIDPDAPVLHVRDAVFTGSLDARDDPTSSDPAMGGTITGCFTCDEARSLLLPLLGETLLELLESSGASTDVDCTGSGTLDGFSFEMQFAGEPVELRDLPGQDGGQDDHDGG